MEMEAKDWKICQLLQGIEHHQQIITKELSLHVAINQPPTTIEAAATFLLDTIVAAVIVAIVEEV